MPAARSADKTTWAKFDNSVPGLADSGATNGRVPCGISGGDTNGVIRPSVIKDGYTYKMWYGGSMESIGAGIKPRSIGRRKARSSHSGEWRLFTVDERYQPLIPYAELVNTDI